MYKIGDFSSMSKTTIKTFRYCYSIYSWNFGSEIDTLMGKNYTHALTKMEATRYIREALMINPYILEITKLDVDFDGDTLKSVHDNVTNNDTSDIDAYMALFGEYQELSNRLVSNGLVSTTEETNSGFAFNADITLNENIRETLGEDYDYNYFYMNAPLKVVSYDMLTKGFDCK